MLWNVQPSVWLLKQMACLVSIFKRTSILFRTMAILFYLAASIHRFSFLYSLALCCSLSSHYNRCEVNLKALICILQISNANHVFVCTSLESCLVRSFILPSCLLSPLLFKLICVVTILPHILGTGGRLIQGSTFSSTVCSTWT